MGLTRPAGLTGVCEMDPGRPAAPPVDVDGASLARLGERSRLAEHRIGLIQLEWNAMSEQSLGIGQRIHQRTAEAGVGRLPGEGLS